MIKLPNNREDWNWHQWLTFRCNFACEYCIMGERQLGGGTPKYKPKEMTGKQIVDFWNNVEHPPMKKLSVIGGEPTLHKDFTYIINNLEGYHITVTTNCGSPYYKNDDFTKNLKTKDSSHLRMNTSFHPDFIDPAGYVRVVKLMLEAGVHVDQTSFVVTPEFKKHLEKLKEVSKDIKLRPDVFLGFWNEQEGFDAAFDPDNAWPNSNIQEEFKAHTGIHNIDTYKQACMQAEKYEVSCDVVYKNMLVDPSGLVYHCHYKVYNEIDPVCHISDFKAITPQDMICKHYGYCLSCDAPHVQKKLESKEVKLNKMLDRTEFVEREVAHLADRLQEIAKTKDLHYSEKVLFESAYMYLYSGHRHSSRVLYRGREDHALLRYLRTKKYKIKSSSTPTPKQPLATLEMNDVVMLFDLDKKPSEVVEDALAARDLLHENGILLFSMHVGNENVPSKEVLLDNIINPLVQNGFVSQGGAETYDEAQFGNQATVDKKHIPDDTEYPYIIVCLRKSTQQKESK